VDDPVDFAVEGRVDPRRARGCGTCQTDLAVLLRTSVKSA